MASTYIYDKTKAILFDNKKLYKTSITFKVSNNASVTDWSQLTIKVGLVGLIEPETGNISSVVFYDGVVRTTEPYFYTDCNFHTCVTPGPQRDVWIQSDGYTSNYNATPVANVVTGTRTAGTIEVPGLMYSNSVSGAHSTKYIVPIISIENNTGYPISFHLDQLTLESVTTSISANQIKTGTISATEKLYVGENKQITIDGETALISIYSSGGDKKIVDLGNLGTQVSPNYGIQIRNPITNDLIFQVDENGTAFLDNISIESGGTISWGSVSSDKPKIIQIIASSYNFTSTDGNIDDSVFEGGVFATDTYTNPGALIEAKLHGLVGIVTWSISPTIPLQTNGNFASLRAEDFGNYKQVTITASVGEISDSVTIGIQNLSTAKAGADVTQDALNSIVTTTGGIILGNGGYIRSNSKETDGAGTGILYGVNLSGQTIFNVGTGSPSSYTPGNHYMHWSESNGTLEIRGKLNADDIVAGTISSDYLSGGTILGQVISGGNIYGTNITGSTIKTSDNPLERRIVLNSYYDQNVSPLERGEFQVWGESVLGNGIEKIATIGLRDISQTDRVIGAFGTFTDGNNNIGISGMSSISIGVFGRSDTGIGVEGFSNTNYGVRGYSFDGTGVYGESDTQTGVYGYSYTGTAICGSSPSGCAVMAITGGTGTSLAISASADGIGRGIYSYSPSGEAIKAVTTWSSAISVFGEAGSGIGVKGKSYTGIGIHGECLGSTYGIYAVSNTGIGLGAHSTTNYSGYFSGGLGVLVQGKTAVSDSRTSGVAGPSLRVSKNWSSTPDITYDTVVIESDDVATLRMGESDGTQGGICYGDTHCTHASTHDIRFFTGGTAGTNIYSGMSGALGLTINGTNIASPGTITAASGSTGQVDIYNSTGEGSEIKLRGNNGTHYFIQNINGAFRGINSGRSTELWSFSQTGVLTAYGFNINSLREKKENIVDFTRDALEIINDTLIVEYNYKDDEDKKYRIGFIADDTDKALSGEKQDTLDITNTVAILIKAVQELSAKVITLEEKLNAKL